MLLIILIIFKILTNENSVKLFKVICPFFFMLTFAQVCDIVIKGGSNLAYFTVGYHTNLLKRFFSFYGDCKSSIGGVTIGIKIEIIIIMIISFFYVLYKTKNYFKALLMSFAFYVLIFFYAITPFVIDWLIDILNINAMARKSNYAYIYYFSALGYLSAFILYLIERKKGILALLDFKKYLLFFLFNIAIILGLKIVGFLFLIIAIYNFILFLINQKRQCV